VKGTAPKLGKFTRGTIPWYAEAYRILTYDKGYERSITIAAQTVFKAKFRYDQVAKKTGVPWWVIGGLHHMESTCNFRGVLHNGELIVGTKRKTRLVPKGRGPFPTWEIAAVDALNYMGFSANKTWSIGMVSLLCERFNGLGYLKYHPEVGGSPYLYAMSSVNSGFGKYVPDGKWNPRANANTQVGLITIVKELERAGEIKL
jgi:lysozyme family protein